MPSSAQIGGEPPDASDSVRWPSKQYPTLQSAIDAVAPGGSVLVGAGQHVLDESLNIVGKTLSIVGKSSKGNPTKESSTQLIGPAPQAVVDDGFNIVLPPSDVIPLFNSVASNLTLQNLTMSGFDAAVFALDDSEGNSGSTTIESCSIRETGRGVLSLSGGMLTITDSEISDTLWNGISVAPKVSSDLFGFGIGLMTDSVSIINPTGAGIYLSQTFAVINEVLVENAFAGGIVGFEAKVLVTNSFLLTNREAGIVLLDSDAYPFLTNVIQDNTIFGSQPFLGHFGDGVLLFNSGSDLFHNNISNNSRAGLGIYGSFVRVRDNLIICSGAFDVIAEDLGSELYTIVDLGGNACGCNPVGACGPVFGPPTVPPPKGGLE